MVPLGPSLCRAFLDRNSAKRRCSGYHTLLSDSCCLSAIIERTVHYVRAAVNENGETTNAVNTRGDRLGDDRPVYSLHKTTARLCRRRKAISGPEVLDCSPAKRTAFWKLRRGGSATHIKVLLHQSAIFVLSQSQRRSWETCIGGGTGGGTFSLQGPCCFSPPPNWSRK